MNEPSALLVLRTLLLATSGTMAVIAWPSPSLAQDKPSNAGQDVARQLADLRVKVARLEAALAKQRDAGASGIAATAMMEDDMEMGAMAAPDQGVQGMAGMAKGGGASMGDMMDMDMMMGMDAMGGGGKGMMEEDMDMMGMMGKGSMGAQGKKMQIASALPGFPGASHIYHIGATDFFLDHPEHITLTAPQQTELNRIKQKSLFDKATRERQIDEAEQALWQLTGAEEPDAAQIQTKVEEIEKLRAEQRLTFIRSVGEAASVLTQEQRQALLGQATPDVQGAHPPTK